MMIQQFVEEIAEGECHIFQSEVQPFCSQETTVKCWRSDNLNLRKGDFRVQVEFGGSVDIMEPPLEVMNQAQKVIQTLKEECLYAR